MNRILHMVFWLVTCFCWATCSCAQQIYLLRTGSMPKLAQWHEATIQRESRRELTQPWDLRNSPFKVNVTPRNHLQMNSINFILSLLVKSWRPSPKLPPWWLKCYSKSQIEQFYNKLLNSAPYRIRDKWKTLYGFVRFVLLVDRGNLFLWWNGHFLHWSTHFNT